VNIEIDFVTNNYFVNSFVRMEEHDLEEVEKKVVLQISVVLLLNLN